MSTEHGEVPHGFKIAVCSGINATVPMPETWFFKQESEYNTRAYFMTREAIRGDNMYVTGFFLNALSRVQRSGTLPSLLAEKFIEGQPMMEPTSDIEVITDGPLTTLRRSFSNNGGVVEGGLMEPTSFYLSATSNDRRDIAYLAMFETPTEKWEEDESIARTMIDNLVLDPRVR